VRQRVWGRYAAIVRHGQVRNEADAQVVRAVLADATLAATLPEAERATLQAVLAAHERQRDDAPPRPARGRRR
jgi:Trk K+ transport system NAD-binding subunit